MRILILGDPCSVWEKEFVQYVLLPLGAKVYIQDNYGSEERYASYYKQADVKVIPGVAPPLFIKRIPKVRVLVTKILQARKMRQYLPFDVIINMFVSPIGLSNALLYKSKDTRVFVYFCGSDIIRASALVIKSLKFYLKKTDGVMLASEAVYKSFTKKIGQISVPPSKIIRFGVSCFDSIDNILANSGKNGCKASLMLDSEKTTVCIGYNASEAQNHLKILAQLKKLPKVVLNQITIILPITYGGSKEYIDNIENIVSQVGCEYKLFRKYMNRNQMSQLWGATDVFINAQTSDGLSGSVLEAIYAGATLINASWIQYREYDSWGIAYEAFSDWEQINSLLCKIMHKNDTINKKNRDILKEHMSWSLCRESWQSVLGDCTLGE